MKLGTNIGWLFNKRKVATTAGVPLLTPTNAQQLYRPNASYNEAYPYINYPVPYVHQPHVNVCGEACVLMLYKFGQKNGGPNVNVNPRGVFEGEDSVDKLVSAWPELTCIKKPGRIASMRLAWVLAEYGPFICSGDYVRFVRKLRGGHFIVVTGIWGEMMLIHDPWHGRDRRKPITWFQGKLQKGDCFGVLR